MRQQLLEVCRVLGVGHQRVAVGEQHRVEGKAFEAAQVHLRGVGPVTGDAQEGDEPLLARLDEGLEGTVRAQRPLPLRGVYEIVELDHVDVVDAHALERAVQALPRALGAALTRLGGEEDLPPVLGEPGGEAQLGVAVAGSDIDVVHARFEDPLEGPGRALWLHGPEGGGAEESPRAVVAGGTEGNPFDHGRRIPSGPTPSRGGRTRGLG